MAVSKLTCPECQTVLRPAKPLPPGKPVKCPECGFRFTAPDEAADVPLKKPKKAADGDDEDAPRKPKKSADVKAGAKKPAAKTTPDKKPAAKKNDEEEGGTYSFAETGEAEKPDIEYAPDMSIKDLRGPAQSALVQPSNALIAVSAIGFFGWVALLVVVLIPTLFPIDNDEDDKTKPPKNVVEIENGVGAVRNEQDVTPPEATGAAAGRKPLFSFFGIDIALAGALGWAFLLFVVLSPIFIGMAYSAFVAYGAVKIQNLEGYGWGIASAIMAMVPLNSGGFLISTTILATFFLGMIPDFDFLMNYVLGLALLVGAALPIAVGAWVLITMRSERVVKGYEYKAD